MGDDLRYPPGSAGGLLKGYLHNLKTEEHAALLELQASLEEAGDIDVGDLSSFSLAPPLTLLRYLRANKFIVLKSFEHIRKNIAYRKAHNINGILSRDPDEILGAPMAAVVDVYPHWAYGCDRMYRPVLYKQYARFDIDKIVNTKLTTIERLCNYHLWEQEKCMEMCLVQSQRAGYIVETITVVIDVDKMKLTQITSSFLSVIKQIAQIDSEQYPETLGALYIINTPLVFPYVWSVVKTFLDPVTVSKIQIFSSKREWMPVLARDIGLENIPANYGGSGVQLDSTTEPYPIYTSRGTGGAVLDLRSISTDSNESPRGQGIKPRALEELYCWDGSVGAIRRVDDSAVHSLPRPQIHDPMQLLITALIFVYKYLCLFESFGRLPLSHIHKYLVLSTISSTVMTIIGIGISSYFVSFSTSTSYNFVRLKVWLGIVMINLCALILFVNLAGVFGSYFMNRPILLMFSGFHCFATIIFCVVSLACFSYTAFAARLDLGSGYMVNYGSMNILLGASSLVIMVFSMLTSVLSLNYFMRLKQTRVDEQSSNVARKAKDRLRHIVLPSDFRTLNRFVQCINLMFSLALLAFGAASLAFISSIGFTLILVPLYGCIYGGLTQLLNSIFGLWMSYTSHVYVTKVYYFVVAPLTMLVLLVSGSVSLGAISSVSDSHSVADAVPQWFVDNNGVDEQYLSSVLEMRLIIAGILCLFSTLFQLVALLSARAMFYSLSSLINNDAIISQDRAGGIPSFKGKCLRNKLMLAKSLPHRSLVDKLIMSYETVMGLFYIYCLGTIVIFSNIQSGVLLSNILLINSSFILIVEGCLAFILGPVMLLYAWMVFVMSPNRNSLGIIISTSQIVTEILLGIYVIEDYVYTTNSSGNVVLSQMATYFVISGILQLIIPAVVLFYETRNSSQNSIKRDNLELIISSYKKNTRRLIVTETTNENDAYQSLINEINRSSDSNNCLGKKRSLGLTFRRLFSRRNQNSAERSETGTTSPADEGGGNDDSDRDGDDDGDDDDFYDSLQDEVVDTIISGDRLPRESAATTACLLSSLSGESSFVMVV